MYGALAEFLLLFKLSGSTHNRSVQSHINKANSKKPAPDMPKQPSASTKENVRPHSSTATRQALAPMPSQTHTSNGAKDSEAAVLIASLRG